MAAAAQGMQDQPREQLVDGRTGLRAPLWQLGPALGQDEGPATQILVGRPQAGRQPWLRPGRAVWRECVPHIQVPPRFDLTGEVWGG